MRPSTAFLLLTGALSVLHLGMRLHAGRLSRATRPRQAAGADLVKRFQLTDLCLFTEARYTRNPALADRHAAFQDHPMALDHFPSGALVSPPPFPSPHARPRPAVPQHP